MLVFGIIIVVIIFWGNGVGIENNEELLNQITTLTSQLSEKDILILQYKKEILDWTIKYKQLEETYELTKHSLTMANDALNNLDLNDHINDSDDYE